MQKKEIEKIIEVVLKNSRHDWVLIGGALAVVAFGTERATEDVDFVAYPESTQEARFELLELAEKAGVPFEALNSAADFFMHSFDGWQEHLLLLKKSSACKIYRPDLTLFLALKLSRATEADLQDCAAALAEDGEAALDHALLIAWLKPKKSFKRENVQTFLKKLR